MGSCISGNGTTYIKKRKASNKIKEAADCFALCKGDVDIYIENKNSSEIIPFPQIKSSFHFYHKDDKLNANLDNIIDKYIEKIKIQKINFEQLYNIFMNYTYDFTKSKFVIFDTRQLSSEKTQLFIKKFPQINYNIKQLENMKKEKIKKFYNFLNGKNLIFILKDESSLDTLEQFIIFLLTNEENIYKENIYILSQYIKKYDETETQNIFMDYLYYFIEDDLLYAYSPKILINSRDIKSSSINYNNPTFNDAYIFLGTFPHSESYDNKDNLKMISKFDIKYLSNKNIHENDIFLNFISKFKIEYIINFLSLNENNMIDKINFKYITHDKNKKNKISKGDIKTIIKQKNIYIPKNIKFEEYYKNIHNELIPLIQELKEQIIENNCILIQFDNNIDNIFMMKLIYIIIFRITGLSFDNIYDYLKDNFFGLGYESIIKNEKEEILNFLV
jgi:hypothetical protein